MEIKSDDKFEITGAQALDILNILNTLQPAKSGRIFISLQDTITKQAQERLVITEKL